MGLGRGRQGSGSGQAEAALARAAAAQAGEAAAVRQRLGEVRGALVLCERAQALAAAVAVRALRQPTLVGAVLG